MNITALGEARFPSPVPHTVSDQARIPAVVVRDPAAPKRDEVLFELAGPRAKLFFDPAKTRAGIVTCGGLCPGLNNVIRALFLELHHTYGVAEVLGFRGGYQGLDPVRGLEPTVITHAFVDNIHQHGGTILGTSRGPVDRQQLWTTSFGATLISCLPLAATAPSVAATNSISNLSGAAMRSQLSAFRKRWTTT